MNDEEKIFELIKFIIDLEKQSANNFKVTKTARIRVLDQIIEKYQSSINKYQSSTKDENK